MGAFIVTLREGFEAALIVGLMLAFLHQNGRSDEKGAVWAGVAAAGAVALAVALALFLSGASLPNESKEMFEALAMLLAALLVTSMIFWMRKNSSESAKEIKGHMKLALDNSSSFALAGIAFVAVGREFVESALFLFASASSSNSTIAISGGLLGLLVAFVLGWLFYKGSARLRADRFFFWTSLIVIGFASWLIFSALGKLAETLFAPGLETAAPIVAILYGASVASLYILKNKLPEKA